MSTAQAVLNQAVDSGVYLFVEQGKLKFKAPGGLPEALKKALGAHKAEVIALLEKQREGAVNESSLPQITGLGLKQAALSFSQQRLWLVNKMAGGSTEYNLPLGLKLVGDFDIDAAEKAMDLIVKRHQSLRTVFVELTQTGGEEPVQQVMDDTEFKFVRHDLTELDDNSKQQALDELIAQESALQFDFTADLMVRGRFIELTKSVDNKKPESVLFLTMHHIASDGWSMGVLVREFITFYQAQTQGIEAQIPPLQVQYIDYAQWQRKWLAGSVLEQQLSFWQQQLADAPVIHDMVLDYPRPEVKSYQGAQVDTSIGNDLIIALESIARTHQMTLFMLLHGALSLVVSRYSNNSDIIIGTPMANRHQVALEGLIGFFINTLPLRVSTDFSTVDEFFAHVKKVNLDVQSHQEVPLEYLVEHCNVARSAAHMPLVEVQFSMDSTEMDNLQLPGVSVSELSMQQPVARWDLNVAAQLNGEGDARELGFAWVYYTKVFSQQTIANMAAQFNQLLANLVSLYQAHGQETNQIKMNQWSLFDSQQSHYLTHELNLADGQYASCEGHSANGAQLLHHLVAAFSQGDRANQLAIISDEQNLTYQQLNEQANQLAHFLQTKGVGPDTLVGVCLERGAAAMVSIVAILKAGGAYVPLDPHYPFNRLEYMMQDAGIEVVLTDSELMQSIEFEDVSLVLVDEHIREQFYGNLPTTAPKVDGLNGQNLAYAIYTSGTTGKPKGVMISHSGAVNMAASERLAYGVDASAQVLQFASLNFDASVMEWVMALCHGACLHIVDETTKRTPDKLADYLFEHQITHTLLPPALLHHLPFRRDLYLQALLVGGEACDQHLVDRWAAQYPMFNAYGPTEVTVFATTGRLYQGQGVHIGRTVANTRLYVLDGQGALVPFGAVGQLWVSGKGLSRGYINLEDTTAQKFVNNDYKASDDAEHFNLSYQTGDLVRYNSDGTLRYVGRSDEQVKIRGFRIELADVEHHLNQIAGVSSSLLLVSETEPGQKHLIAYVVAQQHAQDEQQDEQQDSDAQLQSEQTTERSQLFVQQVREQLKSQLPEHAVPSAIVALDKWPLNASGKIDRSALPQIQAAQLQGEYIAPTTELEKQLVDIWAQILQLQASALSVTGNFFELGGHSLLAVRLIADIRQHLALEVSINQLFAAPTIEALAKVLMQIRDSQQEQQQTDADGQSNAPLRTKVTRFEPSQFIDDDALAPLSFAQQRLWFLDQLEQGSAHYNMSLAMAVKGPLDIDLTEQALEQVIERHQSLRSRFVEVDGQPMQRIAADFEFTLKRVDLTARTDLDLARLINNRDDDNPVRQLVIEDASEVFDLAKDLMIRASWIELAPVDGLQAGVLLFNMHHIASDGWSMGVLVKDFVDAYCALEALKAGKQPEPKAPLDLQYADYATWQRDWLSGAVLEHQLAYWTEQLADVPAMHSLRLATARGKMKAHVGASVNSLVSLEVSNGIERLAKAHQMTPFMLIHAALSLVLSAHSNHNDIVVGTPVANRMQAELEPLIGFFVNTLVLRVNTQHGSIHDGNLTDYLNHVRQVNLDAQAHQDIPFEQLVDHCNVPRNTSHTPLFQILFTMDTNTQGSLSIPGVGFSQLDDAQSVAKFDLDIGARITEQGIKCSWVYDVAIFDRTQVQVMSDHLNALLASWASLVEVEQVSTGDPLGADADVDYQTRKQRTEQKRAWLGANTSANTSAATQKGQKPVVQYKSNHQVVTACEQIKLNDINILSGQQQQQLLFELNSTERNFDKLKMLHCDFIEQAKATPEAIAVIGLDAQGQQQSLTYAQLDEKTNQLAHGLRQAGVDSDKVVGLCLPRGIEMVIAIYGVLKADGAYLPMEPDLPAKRIGYLLEDAKVNAIISFKDIVQNTPLNDIRHRFCLDVDCYFQQLDDGISEHNISQFSSNALLPSATSNSRQLAYVLYTSGSTGQPKGVMIEHQAIVNRIAWMQNQYQLTPSDKVLQKTPYSFDVSLWEFTWTLSQGATLVLAKPQGHKDPEYLAQLIDSQQVSVLHFVPSMLGAYCSVMGLQLPQSLRYVICSGEALGLPLSQDLVAANPHLSLINLYGPTEAAVDVSHFNCSLELGLADYASVPIGKPIDNIGLYVMNSNQQLVPFGTSGELLIGGVGLARGYLNNSQQTAEKFVDVSIDLVDGQQWQQRLYRTGDTVRWLDNGQIEYLGREDAQVKVRGLRIELAEIEHTMRQLELVNDAQVLVVNDDTLVAFIVSQDVSESASDNLADSLVENFDIEPIKQQLAEYLPEHMVPQQMWALNEWPTTDNGKIDRKALAQLVKTHSGGQDRQITVATTDKQILLAKTWAQVLDMPWQQISIDDNFFSLGGHSLLLIRYKAKLREQGYELPVAQLYNQQTIVQLEPLLRKAASVTVPPMLVPVGASQLTPAMFSFIELAPSEIDTIESQVTGGAGNIADIYPLTGLQQGMLFHSLSVVEGKVEGNVEANVQDKASDPYLLRNLFMCRNKADFDSFIGAINQVIERHDALRTQIVFEKVSQPVQVVLRQFTLPVTKFDVQLLAQDDIAKQMHQQLADDGMLLDKQPLIKVNFCQYQGDYYVMLLNHHVLEDNLSIRQIGREIQGILTGVEHLPAPVQYRELVYRQINQDLQAGKAYFSEYLAGFSQLSSPSYQVEGVGGEGATDITQATKAEQLLSADLTQMLIGTAAQLEVSVNAIIHMAWAMVLEQTSDIDDVVFGTVVSGRMADIEGIETMVGMCINTMPLRVNFKDISLHERLQKLHQDLARLAEFEHIPLSQIQQYSELQGHGILFNSILNCRMQYDKQADAQSAKDFAEQGIVSLGGKEYTNYPYTAAADFDGVELSLSVESQVLSADPQLLLSYFAKGIEILAGNDLSKTAANYSLVSNSELASQVTVLTGAERQYPQNTSLVELFEARAKSHADKTAIIYNDEAISYGLLNQKVNQLAHYLIEQCPQLAQANGENVNIGIGAERSLNMVLCVLAVLKAQGTYVPLDERSPAARWQYMASNCQIPLILTTGPDKRTEGINAKVIDVSADADLIARQPTDNVCHPVPLVADPLAYIFHTSGSTGQPKGVANSHQSVISFCINNDFIDFDLLQTHFGQSNFAFDGSVLDMFCSLLNGKRLVMATAEQISDLDYWQYCLDTYQIDFVFITTALFNLIATERPQMLAQFKQLVFGGEKGSSDHAQAVYEHMQKYGHRLANVYGPTETTVLASVCYLNESNIGQLPIGRALANQKLLIIDSKGRVAPKGTIGELYIGGAGLARGYHNNAEKTAESFISFDDALGAPFNASKRWYRSGDLVRLNDQDEICYVGRADNQLKIRGFRIELGEIAQQLLNLEKVNTASVQAFDGPGGDKVIVAYFEPITDVVNDNQLNAEIKAQLQQVLPRHMVPKLLIGLEQMPINSNGKIDSRLLPEPDFALLRVEYQPPQTDTERLLVAIWADLLEQQQEQISTLGNFFDLGGHSLMVVRLVAAIDRDLALKIDVRQIYELPTLVELAAFIDAVKGRLELEQSMQQSTDKVQEMMI